MQISVILIISAIVIKILSIVIDTVETQGDRLKNISSFVNTEQKRLEVLRKRNLRNWKSHRHIHNY